MAGVRIKAGRIFGMNFFMITALDMRLVSLGK
jgi:hypothetical protein